MSITSKLRAAFLAVLLLIAGALLFAGSGPAAANGDSYPPKWRNAPIDSMLDDWRHFNRQCTSWASWRLHERNGFEMPFNDNANMWGERAAARGFAVDMTPAAGAIAWWKPPIGYHVAYVESVSADGQSVLISEYNNPAGSGRYNLRWIARGAVSGYIHFKDLVPAAAVQATPPQPAVHVDHAAAVWAKQSMAVDGGWTRETSNGSAKFVTAGGNYHVLIDGCDAVWARYGVGEGGWTQETNCHSARTIAVSETGLQVLIDLCGRVYAKKGIGWGGWVQETGCDGHKAIAVAGDTQMLLNQCNAVYAKTGIGFGGWYGETDCHGANQIAVGSTGIQLILDGCGAVWARRGIGYHGWMQETGCDGHKAIAIGGEEQIVLNACNAVWAKTGAGWGGWTAETDCGAAKAIAMGHANRQQVHAFDDSIWSRQGIGREGWHRMAGPGSARQVDVG